MSCYTECEHPMLAVQYWRRLQKTGHNFDARFYNAAIDAHTKARLFDESIAVFLSMSAMVLPLLRYPLLLR